MDTWVWSAKALDGRPVRVIMRRTWLGRRYIATDSDTEMLPRMRWSRAVLDANALRAVIDTALSN